MNKTIDYYEENADAFAENTILVDFADVQKRFLSRIPPKGYILDFGCGAGRDTKAFLRAGFHVDAIDGSKNLCQIASKNTGIVVQTKYFSELDESDKYVGIWACASILHLPKKELFDVFKRMLRALKDEGIVYTSFKYGTFEGYRNGRYFTDFTEETFHEFAGKLSGFVFLEEWISTDIRPGRGDEKWLNLILQKSNTV